LNRNQMHSKARTRLKHSIKNYPVLRLQAKKLTFPSLRKRKKKTRRIANKETSREARALTIITRISVKELLPSRGSRLRVKTREATSRETGLRVVVNLAAISRISIKANARP